MNQARNAASAAIGRVLGERSACERHSPGVKVAADATAETTRMKPLQMCVGFSLIA